MRNDSRYKNAGISSLINWVQILSHGINFNWIILFLPVRCFAEVTPFLLLKPPEIVLLAIIFRLQILLLT